MGEEKQPRISETAFSCAHCGAYTTQHWHSIYSKELEHKSPTPFLPGKEELESFKRKSEIPEDQREGILDYIRKVMTGDVFKDRIKSGEYVYLHLLNLHASECYNCGKFSIWVHDRQIYPSAIVGERAHPDMPAEIAKDFDEARSILDTSPRGAAALLRLSIQKLCAHLGEKGKNIDDDIASLVSKGLNPLIQKSLDIVRVIGNEAVHPGVIDLSDDRESAQELLGLVNLIVEQMISQPKKVEALYEKLPASKRKAIEERNDRSRGGRT